MLCKLVAKKSGNIHQKKRTKPERPVQENTMTKEKRPPKRQALYLFC